jgi:hypothetical protein
MKLSPVFQAFLARTNLCFCHRLLVLSISVRLIGIVGVLPHIRGYRGA